ncbi:MAG: hypothetical protein BWK75_00060, partial [Candidatus Altiarchaeales archaeon A3]
MMKLMSAEVENLTSLCKKIKNTDKTNRYAVFMPHFCIDILAKFEGNSDAIINYIASFEDFKNPSDFQNTANTSAHLETKNTVKEGGKATNSAFAIASLGIESAIIAETNDIGYTLLKNFKRKFHLKNLDISHINTDGNLATTCAIETANKNIMMSDADSLKNFGTKNLTEDDFELIKHSEIVAISDWGLNEKGSELAKAVFKFAKSNNVRTFFDPGDPAPKIKKGIDVSEEIKEILNFVDFLSVNEDEFVRYKLSDFKGKTKIIYHTAKFSSVICEGKETARANSFVVGVRRLTGAGDTFNSGFIFGEMKNFEENEKLILANAVAAYYIS